MSSPRILAASLLFSCALLIPSISSGADFPAKVEAEGLTLVRNGVGLCEWGIFEINVYHAALWLEVPCSDAHRILAADAGKRVELSFCRKLSQKQMRKAYRTSFDANVTDAEKEQFGAEIDRFVEALVGAKKGERLTMTHLPGKGVLLQQGERRHGPVGGDAFARLLFRLYLGDKPPTKQLRRQLLAEHPAPATLKLPITKLPIPKPEIEKPEIEKPKAGSTKEGEKPAPRPAPAPETRPAPKKERSGD